MSNVQQSVNLWWVNVKPAGELRFGDVLLQKFAVQGHLGGGKRRHNDARTSPARWCRQASAALDIAIDRCCKCVRGMRERLFLSLAEGVSLWEIRE